MPQVKVHVSNYVSDLMKGRLVLGISDVMANHAQINNDALQVVVYESKYRLNECKSDEDFIFLEILISEKRTTEEKQELANRLIDRVEEITKLPFDNVTVIYNETEKIEYLGVVNRINEKEELDIEGDEIIQKDNIKDEIIESIEEQVLSEDTNIEDISSEYLNSNEDVTVFEDVTDMKEALEEVINEDNIEIQEELYKVEEQLRNIIDNKKESEPSVKEDEKEVIGELLNKNDNVVLEVEVDEKHYEVELIKDTSNAILDENPKDKLIIEYKHEEKDTSVKSINNIESTKNILDTKEKKQQSNEEDSNGTFELLYHSEKGIISITGTKILNFE